MRSQQNTAGMSLILQNGYPYPYPEGITDEQADQYADEAMSHTLEIHGVKCFEWKHELTIEFVDYESFCRALDVTGWAHYDHIVLSAPYSAKDGYNHPAIIVGDKAYCGFIVSSK